MAPSLARALCAIGLTAMATTASAAQAQCGAGMCNASVSTCCGGGSISPHCMPLHDAQCCIHDEAAATCSATDVCCGSMGPGASSAAFCCPPGAQCCKPRERDYNSECCPKGSICCSGQSATLCCAEDEQCYVSPYGPLYGVPQCLSKLPVQPPASDPSAVPLGGLLWQRDGTGLKDVAAIDGVVATVVADKHVIMAMSARTGKTLWAKEISESAAYGILGTARVSGRPCFVTARGTAFDSRTGAVVYRVNTSILDSSTYVTNFLEDLDMAVFWGSLGPLPVMDTATGALFDVAGAGNFAAAAAGRHILGFAAEAHVMKCHLAGATRGCSLWPRPLPIAVTSSRPSAVGSAVGSQRIAGWPFFVVSNGPSVQVVECGRDFTVTNLTSTLPLPPVPAFPPGAAPCSLSALTATNVVIAASCNGVRVHAFDIATKHALWSSEQPIASIARRSATIQVVPFAAESVAPNGTATGAAITDGAALIYTDKVMLVSARGGPQRAVPLPDGSVDPRTVKAVMVGPASTPCLQLTMFPKVMCIDVKTGSVAWTGPDTGVAHSSAVAGHGTSVLLEGDRITAFKSSH